MFTNLIARTRGERGSGEVGFVAFCVVAIALVVLIIGWISTATFEAVPPDKIALHYTGGPFDGTKFVEVVQPGTGAHYYGQSEHLYKLPNTVRTYIISKTANEGDRAGADHITAPSKSDPKNGIDPVPFTFEASVYFTLNMDEETLRAFFEEVCLHDKCWTDDGWKKMLEQFFRKPLEQAVAQEAKKYAAVDLYADPATLAKMNKDISKSLADDINESLGKPFFCGPTATKGKCSDFRVIIKNPTPPGKVTDAFAATAAAKQNVKTATENAAANVATANGDATKKLTLAVGDRKAQDERAAAKELSPAQLAYIEAQALATCAANSNCTLVVTPSGTGLQVNAGG